MHYTRSLSLLVALIGLCVPHSSLAQTVTNPWSTVPSTIPNAVQKINLEQQVDNAINTARHTCMTSEITSLALKGDQVLPYFAKYKADPNQFTRSQVSYAFALTHSMGALPTIIDFLVDPDLFTHSAAEYALYYDYEPVQLVKFGGRKLKNNLLLLLDRINEDDIVSNDGEVILILSSFKNDEELKKRLHSLRTLSADTTTKALRNVDQIDRKIPRTTYSPKISRRVEFGLGPDDPSLTVVIDVALAEMGDQSAVNQVSELIQHGKESDRLFILKACRFVNDKRLIPPLVALVKDTTILKMQIGVVMPSTPHASTMTHLAVDQLKGDSNAKDYSRRICDLALYTLAEKTQIDVGVPDVNNYVQRAVAGGYLRRDFSGSYRRYTDAELEIAYRRLKQFYKIPDLSPY